ncbi:MAG: hypothetical protein E7631_08555 [Ruminococcaceae bacterium]|nr:hypothetical protein [Oscillospiraceae bacterium]
MRLENIVPGSDGYNYMIAQDLDNEIYYYETSNHSVKIQNAGAVHIFPVIDTTRDVVDGVWEADGVYVSGESNYNVVYCCDFATGTRVDDEDATKTYYKRLNLEDSEYFSDEQAERLRAILSVTYPSLSVEDAQKALYDAGFEQAYDLDRSELISATQGAIWRLANADSIIDGVTDFRYRTTVNTARKQGWGGYMHNYTLNSDEPMNFTDGKKDTAIDEIGNRINALQDFFLEDLEASYAPANQVIITNLDVSAPKMVEEGVFEVDVDVLLNGSGSSANDDIALNIYVGDEVVSTQEIVLGTKEYSATVEVGAGQTIKAVVSGTQILPTGVYFYAPEPQDIDDDGIATSREVSQNLISVAAGPTEVYAEKEYTIEMLTVDLKVSKVDDENNALEGAEFALYKNEALVAEKTVDENGELVFEDLIPGTYELVETKAPEGFVLPEKAIEIEVTKDGYVTFDGEKIEHFRSEAVEGEPVRETLDGDAPKVTVDLTPGKTTVEKVATEFGLVEENGAYDKYSSAVREVKATTTEVAVTNKVIASGDLEAPQSVLKFDRNNSADQTVQRKVRDLYTDNGHFTDPDSVTVTGAPEGYPFQYIGTGDYSGHYVSHIRVIYERDEAGNAKVDENGNYIIKELQHSNGTTLTMGLEPTLSFDGPYEQTTGTRPLQFLLKNEVGETVYGYCIDLETGAETSKWYRIANLEDNDYYASEEAENHVRNIVMNGYWGTEEGKTGSLSMLKAALKAALKAGTIDAEYDVHMRNRAKNTGQELADNEYASENYVYTKLYEHITLTDEIIDGLTEGEALDAMQSAIWSFANGSNANLDGTDRMIVGDIYYASSAMGDSRNGVNDYEGAARTKALYEYLIGLDEKVDSTSIINDKTFAKDMTLTVGNEVSEGIYEAELNFTLDAELSEKDDLTVALTYVNADGVEDTITESLTGENALESEGGYYTLAGLKLRANEEFNFALNILGEQYLKQGAYIFTAEGGTGASQTMVSMMEGTNIVNVTKSANITFTVEDYAEARYDRYNYTLVVENIPEESVPPTISFDSGDASNISFMLIDRATGAVEFLYKIDIGSETSFEIPVEAGKISAVFVKQSTSGMFWFAEEVDEETQDAVIECLKANNPSYKGHNAVAFGEGDHDLEFKKNKFVTYTFTGMEAVDTNNTAAKEDNEDVDSKDEEDSESVDSKDEETSDVVTPPEAEPAVFDLYIDLVNAEIASWLYINEAGDIIEAGAEEKPVIKEGYITAVYVKTDSKNVPNAIWTSAEDVDADALADAFDASNAEHIYGAGQFNLKKNKNHYSVLTFDSDALVTKVIDINA